MSEVSPATGAERDVAKAAAGSKRAAGAAGRARPAIALPLEVKLAHARWRHFGWTLFAFALGALLVWKLGAVGKWVGVASLIGGLVALRSFVMTLLHEPGTITIEEDRVRLPRGLCRAGRVDVPMSEVRHAFFLRRVVPWTQTGPLLVVETARGVFTYPRDWFATESEQRRIALALDQRLGGGG